MAQDLLPDHILVKDTHMRYRIGLTVDENQDEMYFVIDELHSICFSSWSLEACEHWISERIHSFQE